MAVLKKSSESDGRRPHIGLEVAAAEVRQAAEASSPQEAFTRLAAVAGKGYSALALPICLVLQRQEDWQAHPQSPSILEALHAALKRDLPASPLLPQISGVVADVFSVQPTIQSAHILCDRTADPSVRVGAVSYLFSQAEAAAARGDLAAMLHIFPSLFLVRATSDVVRMAVLLEKAICTQVHARPQEIVAGAKLFFDAHQELESGFHHAELNVLSPQRVLDVVSRHLTLSLDDGAFSPEAVTGYRLLLRHRTEEADRKRVAFDFAEQAVQLLPAVSAEAKAREVAVVTGVLNCAPHSNTLAGKMFDLARGLLAVDFQAADKAAESAAQLATEVPMRQNATLLRRWIDNPRGVTQPSFLPDHCSLGALYNALGLNTLTETHGGAAVPLQRVQSSIKVRRP